MYDSKDTTVFNNVIRSKSNCECADRRIIFRINQVPEKYVGCAGIDVVFRNVFCVNTEYSVRLEAIISICTGLESIDITSLELHYKTKQFARYRIRIV